MPYHVVTKVTQGRMLLRPDRLGHLRRIVLGILGQAQLHWPDVRLFVFVFMSNHLHMCLQGRADQFMSFVAFVKRELSRRWGQEVGWPGSFYESRYHATALPSAQAQMNCLRYILSHGVKEGLVLRPEDWGGANCALALTQGEPLVGKWLDGTRYGDAKRNQKRREKKGKVSKKDRVQKKDFYQERTVTLSKLPGLEKLDDEAYRKLMCDTVEDVVETIAAERGGKPVLGMDEVCATDPHQCGKFTPPPWFEDRRRLIAWDSRKNPECREYLDAYWAFQRAFRLAGDAYKEGDLTVDFPPRAFRPGRMAWAATAQPPPG